MGMAGATDWARPIIDLRADHAETNDFVPTFTFPRINHMRGLEGAEPASYSATRRKLALVCVALGEMRRIVLSTFPIKTPSQLRPTR